MSNQYYNFLNKELISYFENTDIKAGDRYFLILNSDEELKNLKDAIISSTIYKPISFISEQYDYKTIFYNINNKKFIFIFAHEGITHDFLVTIRNKVSLQKDEWENTVAIFMIKDDLDSITGGAFDLSKQGAPFHTYSLRNNLTKILLNGKHNLSTHETQILKFIVSNNFEDELTKYTLMDFESVYSIIEQEKIENRDYYNLGIFNDKQLETFKDNEINARLKENRQLFDSIQSIHDKGNVKEQLQEQFDEKVTTKLEKNNWYETDFEVVKKSKELMDNYKKIKIDFLDEDFKLQFEDIEIWDKPSGKTKSKSRERNIIIFRENRSINQINIPFSKNININSNYVVKSSIKSFDLARMSNLKIDFKVKNKSNLLIDTSETNVTNDFYIEFTYKHNNNNSLTFKFRILIVNFNYSLIENIKTKYKLRYDKSTKNIELNLTDIEDQLKFNNYPPMPKEINEIGGKYQLSQYNIFNFLPLIKNDMDNIYIFLEINNVTYTLKLNAIANKPVPVTSSNIVRYIYEKKESMQFINNTAIQNTSEYYLYNEFKQTISIENEMLKNHFTNGYIQNDIFVGERNLLPNEVEKNYISLCNLLIETNNLPSLMYYDEKIIESAERYCSSIEKIMKNLSDNEKIIDESILNIHKLGVINHDDKIYFTAFHPLIMRYEIEKTKYFKETSINEKIFKRYNPVSLLPYFVDNNSNFYFSNYSNNNIRWIKYEPFKRTNKLSPDKINLL